MVTARGIDRVLVVDTAAGFNSSGGIAAVQGASNLRQAQAGSATELSDQAPSFAFAFAGGDQAVTMSPAAYRALDSSGFEFINDPAMSSFSSTVVLEAATLAQAGNFAIRSSDTALAYSTDLSEQMSGGSQEAQSLQEALSVTPLFNGFGASSAPLSISPQVSFSSTPTLSISNGGAAESGVLSDLMGTVKVNLSASEFAELAAAKAKNQAQIKLQDSANLNVGQQADPITTAGVPLSSVMNQADSPSADLEALMKDLGAIDFVPGEPEQLLTARETMVSGPDPSGNDVPNSIVLSKQQLADLYAVGQRAGNWSGRSETATNDRGKYVFDGAITLSAAEFRALPIEGVASQESVTLSGTAAELALVLEEARVQGSGKINSLNFIEITEGGDLVITAETFKALDQAKGTSSLDGQQGLIGVNGDIVISAASQSSATGNFNNLRTLRITQIDDRATADVNEQDTVDTESSEAIGTALVYNLDAIEVGVNLSTWATNSAERASADRLKGQLDEVEVGFRLVQVNNTASLTSTDAFSTLLADQAQYNLQIKDNSIDLSDTGSSIINGQRVYDLERLIEGSGEQTSLTTEELGKLRNVNGIAGTVNLSADRLQEVLSSGLEAQTRLFKVEDSVAELKDLVVAANQPSASFSLDGLHTIGSTDAAAVKLELTVDEYKLLRAQEAQSRGLDLPDRLIVLKDSSAALNAYIQEAFSNANGSLNSSYNLGSVFSLNATDSGLIDVSAAQLRAINTQRQSGLDFQAETFRLVDTVSNIDSLINTLSRATTAFSTSDLSLVTAFSSLNADGGVIEANYFPEINTTQAAGLDNYISRQASDVVSHQTRQLGDGLLNVADTTDNLANLILTATDSTPLDLGFVHRIIGGGTESEVIELSYQQFKSLRTAHDQSGAGLTNLNPFDGLVNLEFLVMGTAAELQDLFDLYDADFSNLEASISFKVTDGGEVRLSAVQLDKLDGRINGAVVVADHAENLGDVFDSAIAGVVKDFEVVTGQDSFGNDILIDADDATLTLTVNELGGLPGYVNADVVLRDSDDQLQRVLRADLDYRVSRIETDASMGDGRDGNLSLDLRIGQLERLLENGVEIADNITVVLDPRDTLELNAKSAEFLPSGFVGSLVIEDDGQSLVDLFSGVWNLPANATEVIFRSLDNAPLKLTVQQLQQAVAPYPGFSGEIVLEDSINELANYFGSNSQETDGRLMRIATVVASDLGFALNSSAERLSISTDEFKQLQNAEQAIGRSLFDGPIALKDASAPAVAAFNDTRLQFSVAQQAAGQAVGEVSIVQFLEQVTNPTTPADFYFDVVDDPSAIREFLETANAETVPLLNRIDSLSGYYDAELVLTVAALEQLPSDVWIESLVLEASEADLLNLWDDVNGVFDFGSLRQLESIDSIELVSGGIDQAQINLSLDQYLKIEALLPNASIFLAGASADLIQQLETQADPRIVALRPTGGELVLDNLAQLELFNGQIQGGVVLTVDNSQLKQLVMRSDFDPAAFTRFESGNADQTALTVDAETFWKLSASSVGFPEGLVIRDTAQDIAGLIDIEPGRALDPRITQLESTNTDRLSLSMRQLNNLPGSFANKVVVEDSVENILAGLGREGGLDTRVQSIDLLNGTEITLNATQFDALLAAEQRLGYPLMSGPFLVQGLPGEEPQIATILASKDSRVSVVSAPGVNQLTLTFNQLIELGDDFSGSVVLRDGTEGIRAAFQRGLDERVISVEFPAEEELKLNAREIQFMPSTFTGQVTLDDSAASVASAFETPFDLPAGVELKLDVALLSAFVRENGVENSFLTGNGSLVVTGLNATTQDRYPQVFQNLPNSFARIELQVDNYGSTLDINSWLPVLDGFHVLDDSGELRDLDDFLVDGAFINWQDGDGFAINDGADDMYDGGNLISTNLFSDDLPYSQPESDGSASQFVDDSAHFGEGSSYKTFHGQKIWMLSVSGNEASEFIVDGNLGADGSGQQSNGSFNVGPYRVFYKQVFGASDPSVNHLFITLDSPGLAQDVLSVDDPNRTDFDYHKISGLPSGADFLYAVVAGREGYQYSEEQFEEIANQLIDQSAGSSFLGTFTASSRRNAEDAEGNLLYTNDVLTIGSGQSMRVNAPEFVDNGLVSLVSGNGDLIIGEYEGEPIADVDGSLITTVEVRDGADLTIANLMQLDASGARISGADSLIFEHQSGFQLEAADAAVLQDIIFPVIDETGAIGAAQQASLTLSNYSGQDLSPLGGTVVSTLVQVVQDQVIREAFIPSQADLDLASGVAIEISAADAVKSNPAGVQFKDRFFSGASQNDVAPQIRVTEFSNEDLRSDEPFGSSELTVAVQVSAAAVIDDLAFNPLEDVDAVLLNSTSSLRLNESQALELDTRLQQDGANATPTLQVTGYTGSDLSAIDDTLSADATIEFVLASGLPADQLTNLASALVSNVSDADRLVIEAGTEINLDADQLLPLKGKLVGEGRVIVENYTNQDFTVNGDASFAGLDLVIQTTGSSDISDASGNPLFALDDGVNNGDEQNPQITGADEIHVGGDDVFTLNVVQAAELQENIRGLIPVAEASETVDGQVFVTGYDGTDLSGIIRPAAEALFITFQVESTLVADPTFVDATDDADRIEITSGSSLTLTADQAVALAGKLIGDGELVITGYSDQVLNTLAGSLQVSAILDGVVTTTDAALLTAAADGTAASGVDELILSESAILNLGQYTGVDLGTLITRDVTNTVNVTVEGLVDLRDRDSKQFLGDVDSLLITDTGELAIDNGDASNDQFEYVRALLGESSVESTGVLNVVNVSATTDVPGLQATEESPQLIVDVTLQNGTAETPNFVSFQGATNLANVRNIYVPEFAELGLSFEEAVVDRAAPALDEGTTPDFNSDADLYQFEFIKSVPGQAPGVLRLDMSNYQTFGSDGVRADLQSAGLTGLLAKQGDNNFVLALSIPSGVTLPVKGSDLTLFHQNITGEGVLQVEDYQGEDISKIASTLSSVTIDIQHAISVLPTIDNLPVNGSGSVLINVASGAGFEYLAKDESGLSHYQIQLNEDSHFAVDANEVNDFSFAAIDASLVSKPVIELIGFDGTETLPAELTANALMHAVIGNPVVRDQSGAFASAGPDGSLTLTATELTEIDVISVAAGSTLTLDGSLTELPQAVEAVHGALILDSKLIDGASLTTSTQLIADLGEQATPDGSITVRGLLKDENLSGVEAGYQLIAQVSTAEATKQQIDAVDPVSEVQLLELSSVDQSRVYTLSDGTNTVSFETGSGTNSLDDLAAGLAAADGYGDLAFTITAGSTGIELTHNVAGPQAELATLTPDGASAITATELTPGVDEVLFVSGFDFSGSGFSTVDTFELQDAENTVNATAAELDASHGFIVTSVSAVTPVIEVSAYTTEDLVNLDAAGLTVNATTTAGADLDSDKLATVDSITLAGAATSTADSAAALGDRLNLNAQELTLSGYVAQTLTPIVNPINSKMVINTVEGAVLDDAKLEGVTTITLGASASAGADSAEALVVDAAVDLQLNGQQLDVDGYTTQNLAAVNNSVPGSTMVVETAASAVLEKSKLVKATTINLGADATTTGADLADWSDNFGTNDGFQNRLNVGVNTLTVNDYLLGSIADITVDVEGGGVVNVKAGTAAGGVAELQEANLTTASSVVLTGSASALADDASALAQRLTIAGQALTIDNYVAQVLEGITGDDSHTMVVNTADDQQATLTNTQLALATTIKIRTGDATALAGDAALLADHIILDGNSLSVDDYTNQDLEAINSAQTGSQLVISTVENAVLDSTFLVDATEINLGGAASATAAHAASLASVLKLHDQTLSVSNYVDQDLESITSTENSSLEVTTAAGASLDQNKLADATLITLGENATTNGSDIVDLLIDTTVVVGQKDLTIENYTGGSIASLDVVQAVAQQEKVTLGRSAPNVAQVDTLTLTGSFAEGDTITITIDGDDVIATVGSNGDAVAAVLAALNSSTVVDATGSDTPGDVVLTARTPGLAFAVTATETALGGSVSNVNTTPNGLGGHAAGDVLTFTIGGQDIVHTVTALEAADPSALVAGVIETITNDAAASGVVATAGDSGEILLTSSTAGVPFTLLLSESKSAASAGSIANDAIESNVFASDVIVNTIADATLVASELTTASEVILGGAATATADDAAGLASRLDISAHQLTIDDYKSQSIAALSSSGAHTLIINTSGVQQAALDSTELALATTINVGAGNAAAAAADAAALADHIILGGNSLTVEGYTTEALSAIDSTAANSNLVINTADGADLVAAALDDATVINLGASATATATDLSTLLTKSVPAAVNLEGQTLRVSAYTTQDLSTINSDAADSKLEITTTAGAELVQDNLVDATRIILGDDAVAEGDQIVDLLSAAVGNPVAIEVGTNELTINEYGSGSVSALTTVEGSTVVVNTSTSNTADLASADLTSATAINLMGAAAGSADNVSAILANQTALTITDQALSITDYSDQDLGAIVSGGTSTMAVTTSSTTIANLDGNRLADATSIEISSLGARGTGAAVASLLTHSTISGAGNSIQVNNYLNESIADLDDGLNITVNVSTSTQQLIEATNLGAIDSLVITGSAITTAADITAITADVISGAGSLEITGYGDGDDGSSIAALADSLAVNVVIDAGDIASLDLDKLALEAGDTLTINGNLSATTADLLTLLSTVTIAGTGVLNLTDYTGQDLSGVIGVDSNSLTATLDVGASATQLTADSLGDATKITQISVGDSEQVELSASLAGLVVDNTSSPATTLADRFVSESGVGGTVKITDLADQDLSGFADDTFQIEVTSTASALSLDTTKLADVDSLVISDSSTASVAESDVAFFGSKFVTDVTLSSGTLSVVESGAATDLSVVPANLTLEVSLADASVDAYTIGSTANNAGFFATTTKLTVAGDDDVLTLANGVNLSALDTIELAAAGSNLVINQDVIGQAPANYQGAAGTTQNVEVTTLSSGSSDTEAVYNLKDVASISELEQFKVTVNDGGSAESTGLVRLSQALTSSPVTLVELDSTADSDYTSQDFVFFETDMSRAVTGTENGNSWSEYDGLGFTEVTNFNTEVDSFGFIDSAGDSIFSAIEYGTAPTASSNTMYVNNTRAGDIDNITTVRRAIADGFTTSTQGDTFGFALFERNSGQWTAGLFQVQWNGTGDVADTSDLQVLPVAKLTNINPSSLSLFNSPDFLAPVANINEVNSGLA